MDYKCYLCGKKYIADWKSEIVDHLVKEHEKEEIAKELVRQTANGYYNPWDMPENYEGWH